MTNKNILFLGSGFVAGPCLDQLLKRSDNFITIGCRRLEVAKKLANNHPQTNAISIDACNESELDVQVAKHDLIISLIPYTHHAKVIAAAVKHKKHVVTTSYISPAMQAFDQAAKDAGITVFNEIGVDPGIDHLYAIKTIEEVHEKGGKIVGFLSYCGGLPAPEDSNNPFGYKFSWSSRGVLLALRNDAKFWQDGKIVECPGSRLMSIAKPIYIYPAFAFEGYPNRDSTPYTERYNIPECRDLIRGTLRYQGFPKFVTALVALGFLDDTPVDYLAPSAKPIAWKTVLAKACGSSSENEADLIKAVIAKANIAPEDQRRIISGLRWLGILSSTHVHQKENLLDTLCATLEDKMQYEEGERDMVMLQHKFEIEWADKSKETRTSTGLWFGKPGGDSAMATTVGVPCAITAQLILDGKMTKKGVLAPMTMDVCGPLIDALKEVGIYMTEAIV
ncbi:Saccharopine dehydrogenase [Globomyces pollinis-pini]|nr:Saccharopine dehydrogenase [Globomyces pollinis-pini]